jgi:hypothetical protein
MDKVVRVDAHFAEITFTETGLFGGKKKQSTSNCKIDAPRLERDVQAALGSLNNEGYEVIQIMPVTFGDYIYGTVAQTVGWSFTGAVLIVARRAAARPT